MTKGPPPDGDDPSRIWSGPRTRSGVVSGSDNHHRFRQLLWTHSGCPTKFIISSDGVTGQSLTGQRGRWCGKVQKRVEQGELMARKKPHRKVAALLVGAVLASNGLTGGAAALASTADGGHYATSKGAATPTASSGYNPQIRHNFVSHCISSGGYRSACTCIYRTLVREVPFWKFVQVDRRAAQGRPLPRSWHRIIDRCD